MREAISTRMRLLIIIAAITLLSLLAGSNLVSSSEKPDSTPMVDGTVRAIARVGDNVWVGGRFGRVEGSPGSLVDEVSNVAVFDAATGRYKDVAPMVGDATSEVWDMEPYGDDLAIAGSFAGPDGVQKNLVLIDGTTGRIVRWYDAPDLKSVLAVPESGRIYGGGVGLSAFDASTGQELWTRAQTAVDPGLRAHANAPAYRDLELDGRTIWAACICDSVDGNRARGLVKLDLEGTHDASWIAKAEPETLGLSVEERGGALYFGAGGSDFLAKYSKSDGGRDWIRDTSGSVQAIEVTERGLVAGGHFWEIADQPGDACGHRSAEDPAELDPNGECQTRHGLAAYSPGGTLNPDWDPEVSGRYNLVWALLSDEGSLHFGGEFTEVEGEEQTFYGKLSLSTR